MTSTEIRHSFLSFFAERGHAIVPSSPVVPYDDPTLLFANAGMNQFKDVFLGQGKRSYSRAADTQKCIRVSGKHNDLEEVGRDTYHHTFFEMLGNWSFGDYYKKEAIQWAWDLLTRVWGLPKNRLWATVYKDDAEAEQFWKTVTDIDHSHILRFGEKDNFWEMGETGPCGPCSEIHIDRTPQGNADASLVNAGVPEVMEIWNLVFIQYNRDAKGVLNPLPAKHVDTGMGFERICAVLQNKSSNYDTDVFMPLIRRIGELTHQRYDGRLSGIDQKQFDVDTAMRVLADHIRALTFAIADSATPSNEGRGYVLRRLLRRAARFGRNLGMHEPFLYQLVPTLAETMADIFPEIGSKQSYIQKIIRGEEEGFNATLDRGLEIFEQVVKQIGHSKTFPGDDAFKLYDTFGFPIDLTALLARERGLEIDEAGFQEHMSKQRKRSRSATLLSTVATAAAKIVSADFTAAKLRIQQRNYRQAVPLLEKELENNPSHEEAWYFLGAVKAETGDYDGMNAAFSRALGISNVHTKQIEAVRYNKWGMHLNEGVSFLERASSDSSEYFDKSISEFKTATRIRPDESLTYRYIGYAYNNKGDLDNALRAFMNAWNLGKDVESIKRVGAIYLIQADEQRAQFDLEYPGQFRATKSLDEAMDASMKDKIAELLGPADEIKKDPTSATIEEWIYRRQAATFSFEGGKVVDRKIGKFSPITDSVTAQYVIIKSHYNLAVWALETARTEDPKDNDTLYLLLKAYVESNRIESALRQFESSVADDPGNKRNHFTLGVLYRTLGLHEKAIASFMAGNKIDPNDCDILFDIAATYYNWGVDMIRRSKEKGEESEDYRTKFQAALPFMEKVTECKKDVLEVWVALDVIYTRLGQVDKSVWAFERAQKLRQGKSKEHLPQLATVSLTQNQQIEGSAFVLPSRDTLDEFAQSIEKEEATFVGYDTLAAETTVVKANRHLLVLSATPFYAESGGQIGDQGIIQIAGQQLKVRDTQKSGNVNIHILETPLELEAGLEVNAMVDTERRNAIMRNHTATHLVHAALRKILGTHVHQAGSLVAPEYLRFDFAHFSKVSDQELGDVEALVNEKIRENVKLMHHRNIPFEEAKKMGALMFFGDKYGDRVNVVEFGDFSREFCGGTHVHATEDIGYFKFKSEGSVASGVRRIEAVTASRALELMKLQDRSASERLDYAAGQLQELRDLASQSGESAIEFAKAIANLESAVNTLRKNPAMPQSFSENLRPHFDERARREISVETLILEIADKRKSIEKELSKSRLQSQSGAIDGLVAHAQLVDGVRVVSARVETGSLDELKSLGDTLRSKLGRGVGLLASVLDGKVSLVCVVTDDLVAAKKLEAGKIVGSVAKLLGGGGGGKAHLATAGGKDASKLPEALASTGSIIHAMLVQS